MKGQIVKTQSATPLETVKVEAGIGGGSHVWLRQNITESTRTFEGVEETIFEADEIYFFSPEATTLAEVEEDFASLWAAHEQDGVPDVERQASRISDVEDALIELAELIGGE